jgi:hypothetical protein
MHRTLPAVILLLIGTALAFADNHEAPATYTLRFSGESVETALAAFAQDAGLRLDVGRDGLADGEMPVWLHAEGVTALEAAKLLSVAADARINIRDGALVARRDDVPRVGTFTRGYDVSVAAGRFVDYVNEHGESEGNGNRSDRPKRTAAERLATLIEAMAWECWREEIGASVVGDRILFTAGEHVHGRVREFLQLLINDDGGESSELKQERSLHARLQVCEVNVEVRNTPVGSVIGMLCREAGVGFVIDPLLALNFSEVHIDFTGEGSADVLLHSLLKEHDAALGSGLGVLHVRARDEHGLSGYRVFNVDDLLKRTAAAYFRQRTHAGREEGFEGSLRDAGGVYLIVRALARELGAQGVDAGIHCYGSALIVGGGVAAADAAAKVLKEMGWEETEAEQQAE